MKKIVISVIIACFIPSIYAQKQEEKSGSLVIKTTVDSLSYAMGVNNGQQLIWSLLQEGLDMDNLDLFVQGMEEEINRENGEKDYELGRRIGSTLKSKLSEPLYVDVDKDESVYLKEDVFMNALIASLLNNETQMTAEKLSGFMESFTKRVEERAYAAEIEAEKQFFSENKKIKGIVETPSGLQYKIIKKGKGKKVAGENQMVKVHYTLTLLDGTKIDSSVDRGEAFEFNTSEGVIEAFQEAAKMMAPGSKWIIYAPSKLAYGRQGQGPIPPFSTLVFEIEMLEIVGPAK